MTWIITRELNLFCNPEEIFDFFWANLFALESFKVIHCSVINVLCCFQQLWYIITFISVCQQLFYFFFFNSSELMCCRFDSFDILSNRLSFVNNFFKKIRTTYIANKSGERGIWTLAPVTRPIPLAGAPLRPLEYFSKVHNCQYDVVRYVCDAFNILLNFYLFVNPYFLYFILPVTVAVTVHRLPCEL